MGVGSTVREVLMGTDWEWGLAEEDPLVVVVLCQVIQCQLKNRDTVY